MGCSTGGADDPTSAFFLQDSAGLAIGHQTGVDQVTWSMTGFEANTKFEITVDGQNKGVVDGPQYVSNGMWAGDHSFSLIAIYPDGRRSAQSKTLKISVRGDWAPGMNVESYVVGGSSGPTEASPPAPVTKNPGDDNGLIDPLTYSKPGINKDGYTLAFSDEFDRAQSAVNSNRWNTQLRWDGEYNGERYEYRVINEEKQFYVNTNGPDQAHRDMVAPVHNPFEMDGDSLNITAKVNPLKRRDSNQAWGPLNEMVEQQPFLSGAITTYDKFVAKYGYFEARIKLPKHNGTFPAFWLHHQRKNHENSKRSEIDIMENLGHNTQAVYTTYHHDYQHIKPTQPGQSEPNGQIITGTDYGNDFHVYAVDWQPGVVRWYIDGQVVSELYDSRVDFEEMYILLNLAIGGTWTNFPDYLGGLGRPYPSGDDINNFRNPQLEIDYVRAYLRN